MKINNHCLDIMHSKLYETQLAYDFIKLYHKNCEVDGITLSNDMKRVWNLFIDWHVFANVLEAMREHDHAAHVGTHDEIRAYRIIED